MKNIYEKIIVILIIGLTAMTAGAFSISHDCKQLELKLKKCEQIKLIPHCSEREIILFKDVIDKCFIERD